jgi:hypothetical protein
MLWGSNVDVMLLFMSMDWDYVSELRRLRGLLFIPRVIYECGEPRWNDIDRGSRITRRKTCPSATLSTTNPTWTDPGANLGFRVKRPATNRLSHGTANMVVNDSESRPLTLILIVWASGFYYCSAVPVNKSLWENQRLFICFSIRTEGHAQKATWRVLFTVPARLLRHEQWGHRVPGDISTASILNVMVGVDAMFAFATDWPLTGLGSVNMAN